MNDDRRVNRARLDAAAKLLVARGYSTSTTDYVITFCVGFSAADAANVARIVGRAYAVDYDFEDHEWFVRVAGVAAQKENDNDSFWR